MSGEVKQVCVVQDGEKYIAKKLQITKVKVKKQFCSNFVAERVLFGVCGCPPDDHYPVEREVEEEQAVEVDEQEITLFEYLKNTLKADWAEAFLLKVDCNEGGYYVVARALAVSKFGGFYAKKTWREEVVSLTRADFDKLFNDGLNVVTPNGMVKGEVRVNGEYINVK